MVFKELSRVMLRELDIRSYSYISTSFYFEFSARKSLKDVAKMQHF